MCRAKSILTLKTALKSLQTHGHGFFKNRGQGRSKLLNSGGAKKAKLLTNFGSISPKIGGARAPLAPPVPTALILSY